MRLLTTGNVPITGVDAIVAGFRKQSSGPERAYHCVTEYSVEVLSDRVVGDLGKQAPVGAETVTPSSPDVIRGELGIRHASRTLAPSQQLYRLLQSIVDQEISGQGDQLKEYLLDVEVFRKGGSFDNRIDPVVRTEARRLRNELIDYCAEEGVADPVETVFRKEATGRSFERVRR